MRTLKRQLLFQLSDRLLLRLLHPSLLFYPNDAVVAIVVYAFEHHRKFSLRARADSLLSGWSGWATHWLGPSTSSRPPSPSSPSGPRCTSVSVAAQPAMSSSKTLYWSQVKNIQMTFNFKTTLCYLPVHVNPNFFSRNPMALYSRKHVESLDVPVRGGLREFYKGQSPPGIEKIREICNISCNFIYFSLNRLIVLVNPNFSHGFVLA